MFVCFVAKSFVSCNSQRKKNMAKLTAYATAMQNMLPLLTISESVRRT